MMVFNSLDDVDKFFLGDPETRPSMDVTCGLRGGKSEVRYLPIRRDNCDVCRH